MVMPADDRNTIRQQAVVANLTVGFNMNVPANIDMVSDGQPFGCPKPGPLADVQVAPVFQKAALVEYGELRAETPQASEK
jgi:hypothetical protein